MNEKDCRSIAPCDIRIDKDGIWYFRGSEMFRREIVNFFYQNLAKDALGRYMIVLENDQCYLEVEDVPFIVHSAEMEIDGTNGQTILLKLCDETVEKLEFPTLRIGGQNVLYCSVRNCKFEARFSRAAYYQIAQYIEYEPLRDEYFISLNGHHHVLASGGGLKRC
jgi:hypothetical protein